MSGTSGTEGFVLNQTMLRVRDPEASVAFYRDVLGMSLLQRLDFPDMRFSLYFMAYLSDDEAIPDDPAERGRFIFERETTLELTHNWGTESDAGFAGYHNGNSDPQGFGHLGISVPDVEAACARFEELGVSFVKRPNEGKMNRLYRGPGRYWIEILAAAGMTAILKAAPTRM